MWHPHALTQEAWWTKTFDTFETVAWSAPDFRFVERVPFDDIPVEVLLTAHPDIIEFLRAKR